MFLFGFGGVLASWSGLFVPVDEYDYGNTILFSLLDNVNGGRYTIIIVVVSVLCAACHPPLRARTRTPPPPIHLEYPAQPHTPLPGVAYVSQASPITILLHLARCAARECGANELARRARMSPGECTVAYRCGWRF